MMRQPTSTTEQFAWHTAALAGEEPPAYEDEPHVGFYQRKLVKGGMFVPARIWMEQPIDADTGELSDDEFLMAEVNGQPVEVFDAWPWLVANPISKEEFEHLIEVQTWAAWHAPNSPEANPRQSVDMNTVDLPFL